MTLGEKIQELRRRNAMSQDVLAEKLEVSRQAVSKWERDEAVPETDRIVRIAQLFSVSTDYLLMEEPQPAQPRPQYQYQTPPRQAKATDDRIERFIRRHGYKGGGILVAAGAVLCVIALLVFILVPQFGRTPLSEIGGSGFGGGMIMIDGGVEDALADQIIGSLEGDGYFGAMPEDPFDQFGQTVSQTWTNSLLVMTAMVGIPPLLAGIAMVTLGIVIVVKGKKIARETL